MEHAKLAKRVEEGPTGKESHTSVKEGWLTKQGNYIRNWRPRWFQLTQEGKFYYYKAPKTEPEPTNFFPTAGCTFEPYTKFGPFCFEMTMPSGQRRYMQAQNKQDLLDWLEVLRASAKGHIKTDTKTADEIAGKTAAAEKPLTSEDFNFLKVLGKGNYGKVMLATLKRVNAGSLTGGDPNKMFAVKVIKKSGLIDEESLEHVLSENRVLQTMDHPFLVKLHASFQSEDRLYFVMEYVRGGELFFHIGREKKFPENRARFYCAEILCALAYLHSKGIVYRDLKLENLLLDENGHIKITDFGLCKENISQENTTSTFCGTPEYLAPEILEEESYGKSVDWWALGVVLYEMLVGRPPFGPTSNMEKLFQNILSQPVNYPQSLSPPARSLLSSLLQRDYLKRIGCGPEDGEEIKEHEFFSTIDWNKLVRREIPAPFVPEINHDADVGNFDQEFTQLPAVLTPDSSQPALNEDGEELKITDFSYVAKSHIIG